MLEIINVLIKNKWLDREGLRQASDTKI